MRSCMRILPDRPFHNFGSSIYQEIGDFSETLIDGFWGSRIVNGSVGILRDVIPLSRDRITRPNKLILRLRLIRPTLHTKTLKTFDPRLRNGYIKLVRTFQTKKMWNVWSGNNCISEVFKSRNVIWEKKSSVSISCHIFSCSYFCFTVRTRPLKSYMKYRMKEISRPHRKIDILVYQRNNVKRFSWIQVFHNKLFLRSGNKRKACGIRKFSDYHFLG